MLQPVSSEARRSRISGVLPIEPMNPSRISMIRLPRAVNRGTRAVANMGQLGRRQHYRPVGRAAIKALYNLFPAPAAWLRTAGVASGGHWRDECGAGGDAVAGGRGRALDRAVAVAIAARRRWRRARDRRRGADRRRPD